MNIRALLTFGLLLAPTTCFASDPTGLLILFTIPFLLLSVLIALAIAKVSKTGLGYVGLGILAALNFLPGLFLTIEIMTRGRGDILLGAIHAAAYGLLLIPFRILTNRLKLPKQ